MAQLSKEKGNENIRLEIADGNVDQSMVCRRVDLQDFLEVVELARKRLVGEFS